MSKENQERICIEIVKDICKREEIDFNQFLFEIIANGEILKEIQQKWLQKE